MVFLYTNHYTILIDLWFDYYHYIWFFIRHSILGGRPKHTHTSDNVLVVSELFKSSCLCAQGDYFLREKFNFLIELFKEEILWLFFTHINFSIFYDPIESNMRLLELRKVFRATRVIDVHRYFQKNIQHRATKPKITIHNVSKCFNYNRIQQ